jgi:hypothetical protein
VTCAALSSEGIGEAILADGAGKRSPRALRLMNGWMMTSRPEEDVTVTFPFVFAPGG